MHVNIQQMPKMGTLYTWCRTPGGSMSEVVTLKMQETSFLLAWMTSDSRTDDTSNSASRMSRTCN